MSHARIDEADGVITVTFTRDDKLNAVDLEMFAALEAGVHALAERDDLRVLVITAEGRYFTAGADIAVIAGELGVGTDGVTRGSVSRRQYRERARHDLYDLIESIEKPVVLAAQGPCVGLGIESSASCDFRLASDRATFSLPELANLAVIPGSGGVSPLTRLVGPHWAKWLVMAGQQVSAADARMMGLVHAVYPHAEFAELTVEFARSLVKVTREGLGLAKLTIDSVHGADRRTARDLDRIVQTLLFDSPEYAAKLAAFTTRRGGG